MGARAYLTAWVLPPTPNPEASSCQPNRRGNHCAEHQLCTHHDVRPKVDAERTPGIAYVLQKQALVKERSRVLRAGNPRTVLRLLAPGGPDTASLTQGSWKDSTQDPEDGGGPSPVGTEKPAGWMWGGASSRLHFPASEASFFHPRALLIDLQNPTEQAMGTASQGGAQICWMAACKAAGRGSPDDPQPEEPPHPCVCPPIGGMGLPAEQGQSVFQGLGLSSPAQPSRPRADGSPGCGQTSGATPFSPKDQEEKKPLKNAAGRVRHNFL